MWEVSGYFGLINVNVIPSPSTLITSLVSMVTSGVLFVDVMESIKRVGVGFLFASVLGVTGGVVAAHWRRGFAYVSPVLECLRPIPPIAWIPIAILWFGVGDMPAYFLVALGAFFPVFTNTYHGVSSVDRAYMEAARALGAGRKLLLRDVVLPAALPEILAGLRIGLGVGWMVVITAELVGAMSGLGYMIQLNRVLLQTQNVVAGMAVIGMIGFAMSRGMQAIERRLTLWHTTVATESF
jgi:NitT/TauT family transport system permease protein/sulfonate transport system permease protein